MQQLASIKRYLLPQVVFPAGLGATAFPHALFNVSLDIYGI